MNHTPTPWVKTYEKNIIDANGNLITRLEYGGWYLDNAEANAKRIVDCVNACADMQDPVAEIAQLRARVAELENPWIPISEIHLHGYRGNETLWVAHRHGVCEGYYQVNGTWCKWNGDILEATHFMFNRVPQPPKPQES